MKTPVILLLGCFTCTVMAQTPLNQPVQTPLNQQAQTPLNQPVISAGPGTVALPDTNVAQGLMITNQAGATFQVNELDAQLAALKGDVERTLPMLSAVVSQTGSPTTLGRTRELANAASNFIAHAFGHETNNGTSPRMTNFAGFLHNLMGTNTGGAGGVNFDPNTVRQLGALQNDLQQVLSALNNLNVGGVGATNEVPGNFRGLTPTGR